MFARKYWLSSRSGPCNVTGRSRRTAGTSGIRSSTASGHSVADVAVQERPRRSRTARVSPSTSGAPFRASGCAQDTAEVGDRPRSVRLGPVLGRQEMRHRRPGVKGRDETADGDPGGPANRALSRPRTTRAGTPVWPPSPRCRPSIARPERPPGVRHRCAAPCRGRWRTRRRRSPLPPPGCSDRRRDAGTRTTRGRPRRAHRRTVTVSARGASGQHGRPFTRIRGS